MITEDRIVVDKTNKIKEYTVIPLSTGRFQAEWTIFFPHILFYQLNPD